jgi:DNA-binding NarL/FixJ family response regulator
MLQMNHFDAIPYSDPLLAVHAAKTTPPDYLVSDIAMPGMTGIEVAIAIQREAPKCKVLLFSGQVGASELIKNATAAGHSFELLQKPIHPKELVEAIRNL